ncbi:MAG: dephospho-CoA kinase [Bacteroidales bacterium]|nr:dephospho-CoA kinase [Bacteroidales bacterium]
MIKVGLTGNIGTGKSTIARIFEVLGIPVFKADEESKKLLELEKNQKILLERYGKSILKNGFVDRKKLASIIFSNMQEVEFVNQLFHPQVRERFMEWVENQESSYVVHEAAILFESGFYKFMDRNIVVVSPLDLAVERVMQRDGVTREQVLERKKNQWAQEKITELSDFIVVNDEQQMILPQVLEIHNKIVRNIK